MSHKKSPESTPKHTLSIDSNTGESLKQPQGPSLPNIISASPQQSPKPLQIDQAKAGERNTDENDVPPRNPRLPSPVPDNQSQSSRSFTMHSILNHSGSAEQSHYPAIPLEAMKPRSTSESSPASATTPLTPSRSLPPMNGFASPFPQGSRPSLPPAFSTLRSLSVGTTGMLTSAIDARKSPFLASTGKPHTYSPETNHRSLTPHGTTPPAIHKLAYPISQPLQVKTEGNKENDGPAQAQSQSNSPTTSYSSHGAASRTSPSLPYVQSNATQPSVLNGQYLKGLLPAQSAFTAGATAESNYTSMAANGTQNAIQLMTLNTENGPIQVPVDVQAASKVADEKRKRNAGASARFRQRRKEKEREASQMIAKLESKVREIGEEKEYYRMERDYFRSLVYTSSAQAHVIPRLPSPRQRKSSATSTPSSSTATGPPDQPEWQQNGERGSDDGRNQRRRISGFFEGSPQQTSHPSQPPPPPPPPPPAPTSAPAHPSRGLQYPPASSTTSTSSIYPPYPEPRVQAHPPPPLAVPPSLRSDTFGGGSTGYERSWPQPRT